MGYDLALFAERVDDNFLCAICHQCVKDAVTGCSHGHAFCAGCLATWRQHGTTCPMCCVDISHVQPTPCLPLQSLVKGFRVRCGLHDENGKCGWEGKVESHGPHRETCDFAEVACDHDGCDHVCSRRQLAAHKATCAFKPLVCELCALEMPPGTMEAHLAEDCPEQIVDCVLASCGCKARPKRCEQLEHQQLAAESHAELCAAQAERLRLAEARGTSQARLLAATDSWVLDEDQAEATLKKIRSEALTESGRVELADRGALQARARATLGANKCPAQFSARNSG